MESLLPSNKFHQVLLNIKYPHAEKFNSPVYFSWLYDTNIGWLVGWFTDNISYSNVISSSVCDQANSLYKAHLSTDGKVDIEKLTSRNIYVNVKEDDVIKFVKSVSSHLASYDWHLEKYIFCNTNSRQNLITCMKKLDEKCIHDTEIAERKIITISDDASNNIDYFLSFQQSKLHQYSSVALAPGESQWKRNTGDSTNSYSEETTIVSNSKTLKLLSNILQTLPRAIIKNIHSKTILQKNVHTNEIAAVNMLGLDNQKTIDAIERLSYCKMEYIIRAVSIYTIKEQILERRGYCKEVQNTFNHSLKMYIEKKRRLLKLNREKLYLAQLSLHVHNVKKSMQGSISKQRNCIQMFNPGLMNSEVCSRRMNIKWPNVMLPRDPTATARGVDADNSTMAMSNTLQRLSALTDIWEQATDTCCEGRKFEELDDTEYYEMIFAMHQFIKAYQNRTVKKGGLPESLSQLLQVSKQVSWD